MRFERLVCAIHFLIFVLMFSSASHAASETRTISIDTEEVTRPGLAISPGGDVLIFTALGHLFRVPEAGGAAEQLTFGPWYHNSVMMMAWYHRNDSTIEAVATSDVLLAAMLSNGGSALAFAVDHVYWTAGVAEAGERYRALTSGEYGDTRTVLLLGTTSERCRTELTEMGFTLRENLGDLVWPDAN